ncbi:polysaccharide pyruvyl transferase family protein [Yoonia sp.]|uniref:polysaccharide pyruvyl transferase family protein n=1 Tax=Yoonia sp. TaxID=2212373 RepID=UPI003918B43E
MINRGSIGALSRIISDLKLKHDNPGATPVVYFTGIPNVGDLLNEYLIPRLSGSSILRVSSSMTPHIRAVGSVIGSASQFSYIWGSGSIDGHRPKRSIKAENIYALRGKQTRDMLSFHLGVDLTHVPLGDPAVLMPHFYNPSGLKVGCIGVIPHFSDEDILSDYVNSLSQKCVKIISVRQQPEDFINDLCQCDYVFSSSLHGLILADSYNVPNRWISVSDRLLGGSFKFMDYYSTTDRPAENCIEIDGHAALFRLVDKPSNFCKVKAYTGESSVLLSNFPPRFRGK